jgi:WD40 repeat protein
MIAFTPHTGKVTALGFSPDGSRIVSASSDGSLKLWDVASLGSGPPVWEVDNERGWPINHCQFSWDGERVYAGDTGGLLKAWGAADGRLRAATDPETYPDAYSASVNAFALSLCGKFVAYGGGLMWLPTEFVVARTSDLVPVRRVPGHGGAVGVFVPQAGGFVSGSADQTVRLWDWHSAACHGTIKLRGVVRGLAGSRDGRHIAVAGGALVRHYSAAPVGGGGAPEKVGDFRGHTKRVNCIEFSPDGARLASASQDGTLRVWDAATRAELRALHPRLGSLHWVTFAPDGLTVAYSSARGDIGLLDLDD